MSDKSWGLGEGLISSAPNQVILGTYNMLPSTTDKMVIGNGTDADNRKSILVLSQDGDIIIDNISFKELRKEIKNIQDILQKGPKTFVHYDNSDELTTTATPMHFKDLDTDEDSPYFDAAYYAGETEDKNSIQCMYDGIIEISATVRMVSVNSGDLVRLDLYQNNTLMYWTAARSGGNTISLTLSPMIIKAKEEDYFTLRVRNATAARGSITAGGQPSYATFRYLWEY